MARHTLLLAGPVDGLQTGPPELGDVDYVREVLARPDCATEADIEQELVAKATALQIELPISGQPSPKYYGVTAGEPPGTPGSQHTRAVSTGSDGPEDTGVTPPTSDPPGPAAPPTTDALTRKRSRTVSFSQYDRYISQVDPALAQPKPPRPTHEKSEWSAGIVIKSGTRKGVRGFTRSIAARLRRKRPSPNVPMPCICCREEFTTDNDSLHTLPCGHCYCRDCLAIMVEQSMRDESKMPPRCCTQPIPSAIIKLVLPREKQQLFLKAVVQYSTPWEARIFCPNTSCGEFIPPADRADPKHPFEALCKTCRTRVCVMCKRNAHRLGQDCPEDHDSDAVLKMGESSGWRRCYKCRSLVELAQGCTHITCRCKAQFCYICGAVWDPAVGCPDFCNGEEEMERRRAEEEARLAELEAEKAALEKAAEKEEMARQEAEKRTRENSEFGRLRAQQEAEMARFEAYEQKVNEAMRVRQSNKKLALVDKFSDLADKMRERHAKTEQHLEDRQVMAEIEMQAKMEEKEKKVRIKLKYMEDYCNGGKGASAGAGAGTVPPADNNDSNNDNNDNNDNNNADDNNTTAMPQRQVTDRDREQLRQQYCVRDGMARRHRSQINGLREKQAKSMEELVARHAHEMETLVDRRRADEMEHLAVEFTDEEELLLQVLSERRARLESRWRLAGEILRVELERREKRAFAVMALPKWSKSFSRRLFSLFVLSSPS
ncbi:hypothetical protein C8A00DRAFT_47328 [Chaetomidium leptoderma]|uniref:RBR-type E3 ubiquitin transferase n=1 Tax=Chaetomidium leptoderma TaxID=669021 RepID=A0AAN6VDB4_9PEZI|nr:hypothetical protein C8A00DRAFT_47328 [Chaetomidium leptoderma]